MRYFPLCLVIGKSDSVGDEHVRALTRRLPGSSANTRWTGPPANATSNYWLRMLAHRVRFLENNIAR